MTRKIISAFFALILGATTFAESADAENYKLERYGDIAQVGIPAAGLLLAFAQEDYEGAVQALEGAFWTFGITQAVKYGIDAERPNGGGRSFPSGHTSAASQGAAFIYFRYGPKYGIPAYAAAALVGYSRVENDYHYWHDVAAGMALATGVQYLVTKKGWSMTASPKMGGFNVMGSWKF